MKLFNGTDLTMPSQVELKKLIEQGERDLSVLRRIYKWRCALDEGREPEAEPETEVDPERPPTPGRK